MANQILPTASLNPTAAPVDRFVTPVMDQSSGWEELSKTLSVVNPKLQAVIKTQYERKSLSEEAEGAVAADSINPSDALNNNREGWKGLIDQVRARDAAEGTDNASALVGASPHFQRGLVKTKTKRVAMGLQNHLQLQWQNDVGGIKAIDSPKAVQEWISSQTAAYAQAAGVQDIDPLITAEIFQPTAMQASAQMMGDHQTYRAKAKLGQFAAEFEGAVGMIATGASGGSSSVEDFIARMTHSESSGRSGVINDEGYGGWMQFGQARLDDYNNIHGTSITVAQFAADEALQKKVNVWHINAVDKEIDKSGYLALGYSRDGLRAVRHLGGWGGVEKFVANGGKSDIADSNGTTLTAYYNKFASSARALEGEAQQAIANGLPPKDVNKLLVESIIAQAKQTGNAALMDILDDVNTGNGPLGNVGWVKEERLKAAEYISDEAWEEEDRAHSREVRERADAKRTATSTGFAAILDDPFGDHSGIIGEANGMGEGKLAQELYEFQKRIQRDEREVVTDHNAVIMMRNEIMQGALDDGELTRMVVDGVNAGLYDSNVGSSLMTAIKTSKGAADFLRDPGVRNWIDNATAEVKDLTQKTDPFTRDVVVSGREVANRFEEELTDEVLAYVAENPDVSKEKVRLFVRKKARELRKEPEYGGGVVRDAETTPTVLDTDGGPEAGSDPLASLSDAQVMQAAENSGMTTDEYIKSSGSTRKIGGSWWNPFD